MRALPFLLLLVGCGASDDQLRARAAFDFKCDAAQVQVVPIDSRTQGVRACGQQGTYVQSCENPNGMWNRQCTWILNTDSSRAPKPASN